MKFDYEVLIIGGGPAGLSAGMSLGRMSRTALVCDDSRPRNAPSSHLNNFPTRDGIHPTEWRRMVRKDLEKYKTIRFFEGSVLSVEKTALGFVATFESGEIFHFRKVILAYGVEDKPLPVPGFQELWGKSIFHCPYCHGFEIRGSSLGLISNNELTFHMLPLVNDLASDLILFTNGKAFLGEEEKGLLKRNRVKLIEEKISGFLYEGERLKAVSLENAEVVEREAVFFHPTFPFTLKSRIGESLGCERNQFGFYKVNERGATSVEGVFACGDNVSPAHSVLLASASGATAGAGVVSALLGEEFKKNLAE
ncbi:NAD(P)/FAD-dependent oxidoreductase [Leptospira stimsonii]|uniref:NAD(P)/FAD-dependent oxidoreductase n=1 Tax=Leptospira stimsonii TaxID=2202203 RepID=A0ABY2NEH5_9LEPT|nr:NAD(P)/FAD-dependent oxidoreductase [Leptospira stimsonii]TGK26004.1 NAD(P)/FAD-dependent oxidoreductase [Leptospira stimsonii]TGM22437.1 NAD(P)/FAD-dependent oxidoreductase [Leptospira stimsonii]